MHHDNIVYEGHSTYQPLDDPEHEQEEQGSTLDIGLKPSTLGSIVAGLLLLCSPVGLHYYETYGANKVTFPLLNLWPLCWVAAAYILIWFLMIVPFALSCCPVCRKNKIPFGDIAFSCLAQLFAISVVVLYWELAKTGCSGKFLNYCSLFEGLSYLALLILTLPWAAERTDIPMALGLLIMVPAVVLSNWDSDIAWNWADWEPANWFYFVSYAFKILLFVCAACLYRLSVRSPKIPFVRIVWTHLTVGMVCAIAAATGFEVVPNWETWKASLEIVSGRIAGEMILASLIAGAFFLSLIFLVRFSDLLTTAYSFGLSLLIYIAAPFLQDAAVAAEPTTYLREHPIETSGVALTLVLVVYWVVRIISLQCCYNLKHKDDHEKSLLEQEHLIDGSGRFARI